MNALKQYKLEDIVLLDIETVRIVDELLPDTPLYESWQYKMRYSSESEKFGDKAIEELFKDKAALYAEFGKIVCITIGMYKEGNIVLKSYSGTDEKELLLSFCKGINALQAANKSIVLATHAGKGFDIPYIMRRLIINRIELPNIIDIGGLKPWLVNLIDTKELWQASGFYSASLINIAVAMDLPSPKQDMAGHETSDVYYKEENGVERIAAYCEEDVKCLGNIILIMYGLEPYKTIKEEIIVKEVGVLEKVYNTKTMTKEEKMLIDKNMENVAAADKKIADDIIKTVTA